MTPTLLSTDKVRIKVQDDLSEDPLLESMIEDSSGDLSSIVITDALAQPGPRSLATELQDMLHIHGRLCDLKGTPEDVAAASKESSELWKRIMQIRNDPQPDARMTFPKPERIVRTESPEFVMPPPRPIMNAEAPPETAVCPNARSAWTADPPALTDGTLVPRHVNLDVCYCPGCLADRAAQKPVKKRRRTKKWESKRCGVCGLLSRAVKKGLCNRKQCTRARKLPDLNVGEEGEIWVYDHSKFITQEFITDRELARRHKKHARLKPVKEEEIEFQHVAFDPEFTYAYSDSGKKHRNNHHAKEPRSSRMEKGWIDLVDDPRDKKLEEFRAVTLYKPTLNVVYHPWDTPEHITPSYTNSYGASANTKNKTEEKDFTPAELPSQSEETFWNDRVNAEVDKFRYDKEQKAKPIREEIKLIRAEIKRLKGLKLDPEPRKEELRRKQDELEEVLAPTYFILRQDISGNLPGTNLTTARRTTQTQPKRQEEKDKRMLVEYKRRVAAGTATELDKIIMTTIYGESMAEAGRQAGVTRENMKKLKQRWIPKKKAVAGSQEVANELFDARGWFAVVSIPQQRAYLHKLDAERYATQDELEESIERGVLAEATRIFQNKVRKLGKKKLYDHDGQLNDVGRKLAAETETTVRKAFLNRVFGSFDCDCQGECKCHIPPVMSPIATRTETDSEMESDKTLPPVMSPIAARVERDNEEAA